MTAQFRLLVRHFLRRFLDNDLVSPNAESQANTALFLAFLVVPNLLGSVLLAFKYGNPWTTPCQRLLLGLDDKLAFLSTSMILTGLVTVVAWDALWLDARDRAILGPLPLAPRTLVGAKLGALALFVGLVAVLVNVIPTLCFPYLWLLTVPLPFTLGLWVVAVHALVSAGSAVFAFATLLGLRGLLLAVLPPRAFRVASTAVQFVLMLALVSAFLLSPAFYHHVDRAAGGNRLLQAAPPMWFLGLYERLTAHLVIDNPGVISGAFLYRESQVPDETAARGRYLALEPTFGDLAGRAVVGFAVVVTLALGLFALGQFRRPLHLSAAAQPGRPSRWWRQVRAVLVRPLAGADPVTRASYFFTLQTMTRSARHRLYIAGYLAGGLALVVASQDPRILRDASARVGQLTAPEPGLLVLQLVLVVALIAGLRVGFPVPAALGANWIFRLTQLADPRPALAGPRRALGAVALGVLVLLTPLHAALWGWWPAVQHFIVGALLSLVLVEALLLGFHGVPYTRAYAASKSRLRYTWPLYLFLFWSVTYLIASVEHLVMRSLQPFAVFILVLVGLLVALQVWRHWRLGRMTEAVFDEGGDAAFQTLGLAP